MTADLDPCQGSTNLGTFTWHLHPVTCARCGRQVRAACWTGAAHACGPCSREAAP